MGECSSVYIPTMNVFGITQVVSDNEKQTPIFPEPRLCQRSTPTVAVENSVRVLPWRSRRRAFESRNKPHPLRSFSTLLQPKFAAAMEPSAIAQTQGAIRAPLGVDHSQ